MAAPRIFFGSLELAEKKRQEEGAKPVAEAVAAAAESLPFSEKTAESQEKHKKVLQEWENRKRARQIALPTDDKLVQLRLRELGEPIIYFGEQAAARRERLREVLGRRGLTEGFPKEFVEANKPKQEQQADELFYTEGSDALREARLLIADFSLGRARARLEAARRKRKVEDEDPASDDNYAKELEETAARFRKFGNTLSQVGDERPLVSCAFSPDASRVATSAWSGVCKVWKASDCTQEHVLRGHTDRATCIKYHPLSGSAQSESTVNLASCSYDKSVLLWSLSSAAPLRKLSGHYLGVNRLAFHPSGRYLASTCQDNTWYLWDVETGTLLLEQEGHSKPLYAIAFQCDGSLAATGGNDNIGRVWDVRTGKSVHVLRGHSKRLLDAEFHPNGYQLATASEDNTVRIWDLRKRRAVYTLPAHQSLVATVRFDDSGTVMVTASHDGTAKIWSAVDWSPIRTLLGGETKVYCADISRDLSSIVTANFDRTWRLFQHDPMSDL
eukprot:TRINITY_DN213_c0_g3_i1.p1 TRINITY_DN213_c0_g3~~TRINITY_DN213_c0_g3_i1.p1  ORF type:complete len:500 (-),score=166.91 TRINITY_DN213_c0_g3_i1:230-1729(-)